MAATTTAEDVFRKAIYLMDEQNESTGDTDTQDTEEYRYRTLAILNTIRGELFPLSDTYEVPLDGKRPVCPEIRNFEDVIYLDDVIAQTIMPYGLAYHLILGEDNEKAAFFLQRYQDEMARVGHNRPGQWVTIRGPFD